MFVSQGTLKGLISDVAHGEFMTVLTPLWTKAWDLGYSSAVFLVTGNTEYNGDSNKAELEGFIQTEGIHWLQQISRTGLGNSGARSEMIARTEVARAMNAGAEQAYKDNGVSYKHLLVAPDERKCEICKNAKRSGIIPLDAPFPDGGQPPFHVSCRCIAGPAGIDRAPPLADLKKSVQEDENRVAWLLLRARDEDGKWRFLLQQRDDGTWGMPGGSTHEGEDPWDAAVRESTEEIGDLPHLTVSGTFHHAEDDGKMAFVYMCDVPFFKPKLNGSTPEETQGVAWFRRKEVGNLDLTPKFREDWDESVRLKDAVTKALQRMVNENGETIWLDGPGQQLQAVGGRWPYPHRADGTEEPEGSWPDAGPGSVPSELGSAGAEPPGHYDDNFADRLNPTYPRGSQDGKMPRRRKPNPPASRFPDQGEQDQDMWPEPQTTGAGPGDFCGLA